ncbi:hypothetical protein C4N20_02010 [Fusobacterium ulcerans]|uniref:DUF2802 domain-containing protein n=1 Tax=Fusobacterium ulcerans TaxID=861 RepID=A0AAX2JCC8_9FUSO|nr:hypothetical protein [Fusobacterium ulcerans]AVQ26908.1 hypothetical protein C4N20_02010 [Fusobacterium ulcerans]EFS24963.1 hypothetical protein FUAG_00478 [Fusobacterium ulcerans ATCC 49185]SQJ09223.1 Uncharacterised protein [Fusobacterium ulcerans]
MEYLLIIIAGAFIALAIYIKEDEEKLMTKIEKELELRKEEVFFKVKDKIEEKVIREVLEKMKKLEETIAPIPSLNFKNSLKIEKQCLDLVITLGILKSTRCSNGFETLGEIFEKNEIVEIMEEIK